MVPPISSRKPFDLDAYIHDVQTRPCFLCAIAAKDPKYEHHIVYEDDTAIAFLNKYPTLYGYTLVAPKEHREQVTGDFTVEEYLELQRAVHRLAEAVRLETEAERVCILSLGSQQGNKHVHWHIAPLPPGMPFEEQQLEALAIENGILDLSDAEMAELAGRLRKRLADRDESAGRTPHRS
jgi:diadenosine tetraphosphate (Ap4A) HIT family hydrolase